MNFLEALFLGLIQGITEFLPISSSGHLKIAQELLGTDPEQSLKFTIVVHGATVLASIIVFWKTITGLFSGVFKFKWNESTQYTSKIFISMIPIALVGFLLKTEVKDIYEFPGTLLVGFMLIVTASVLLFAWKSKDGKREISFRDSLIIGCSQAVAAILPGLSRSGVTIGTALILKIDRAKAAQFSFIMVIIPILGEIILDILKGSEVTADTTSLLVLITGFVSAFITGYLACKFVLKIVMRGKIQYFAIYCAVVGILCMLFDM